MSIDGTARYNELRYIMANHVELEAKKFWLAMAAFIVQGAGTVFYMGSQLQFLKDELAVMRRDLGKLETNQSLLIQTVKDIALLQAKDVEFEKRLEKVERH